MQLVVIKAEPNTFMGTVLGPMDILPWGPSCAQWIYFHGDHPGSTGYTFMGTVLGPLGILSWGPYWVHWIYFHGDHLGELCI